MPRWLRALVLAGIAISLAIVCYVLATQPAAPPPPPCAALLRECERALKVRGE